MSLMLKRGIEVIVAVALVVLALLAVVPAVAQAQEGSAPASVLIRPGDTLWSISEERLGPQATPQRIADGVERIYALNRNRIGSDPNLLFAGQKLRLPSAVERQAPEPGPGSAARERAERGAATLGDDARRHPQQSAGARPEPVPLPEPARATPVPAARSLTPHDASPSLAQSVASEARSSFSSVVAVAGEALPRGADSGRKLLGATLIAVSSVLAIILALHVARILWGPRYAERRELERWVREWRRNYYASLHTFDTRDAYAAASAAFEGHPSESSHQKDQKAAKLALVRGLRPLAHSGLSANRAALNGTTSNGATSNGATSSNSARDIPRRRQIVDTEFGELDASQEWEIGEPLRRAVESIPLQPGVSRRHALSEVKPLAEDALRTLVFRERHRHLTDKEHRQARALRSLLAALEEEDVEIRAG